MAQQSAKTATWTGLIALVQQKGESGADVTLTRLSSGRSDCLCVLVEGAPLKTTVGAVTVLRGEHTAAAFLSYFGVRDIRLDAANDTSDPVANGERECCKLAAGRLVSCRDCPQR